MMNVPYTAWAMWADSPNPRKVLNESGFVLHQSPFRETSSLLDIITHSKGRLRLLAKGSKRLGSFGSRLQPFTPLSLSWSGRGELPTLTQAENNLPKYHLSGNSLYCGLYLNELLLNLLPAHDPYPDVFDHYHETLVNISHSGTLEVSLRYFEFFLLESLGYGLPAENTTLDGMEILADKRYVYILEEGIKETCEMTPDAFHGRTLIALQHRCLEDELELREAKKLMRRLIAHYSNGKPIRSRALFRPQLHPLHKS